MRRDRTSIAPQILDEASYWFVEMRELSVAAERREAFAAWLCASPVHVGAYLEIARLWGEASRLGFECAVEVEAAQSASNVVPIGKGGPATPPASGPLRTARRRVLLVAAAFVGCVAAGVTAWWRGNPAPTYVTDVGEQRLVTLEDGSVVRLNACSEVRVRISRERRQLDLLGGQALFEVARDTARPFVVQTGEVMVRAVGTSFDVNRRSSGTAVTVVEGDVLVERRHRGRRLPWGGVPAPEAGPAAPIALGAGEQVTVSPAGAIERHRTANIAAATSWLQRKLIFDGQPLRDVVEEFNRHLRTPIVLADRSLQDLRINAVFHTQSPDSLLRFLARLDGVEVQKSEAEIRLSRTPSRK